jgi:succinate dehydrogenase/fumarate reductase flavoprotein subunit
LSTGTPTINESQIESEINKIYEILERKDGIRPWKVRKSLQNIMQTGSGIIRSQESLSTALSKLKAVEDYIKNLCVSSNTNRYNYELRESLELHNMVEVAYMIIRAALMRTESRGAHYREDFPNRDDKNWLKNIIIKKENEEMKIFTMSIITTSFP